MVLNKKDLLKSFAPPNKLRKLNNRSSTMVNHSSTSADGDVSNVNVFVRVRPANEKERSDNFRTVVKVVDEKLLVFDPQQEQEPFFFRGTRQKMRDIAKKQNKQLKFLFDGVFGPEICNWDIHCKTTHNIIASLLEGYNCSVFVYGATGAGKTFTMLGKRQENPGIMYHTMAELYEQISSISQEKNCHVGVSFVEVYNENVFDLLNPSGPLFLREDASGVTIVGLKVENISNADQLLEKLAQGNSNRTQHPTDSNAESSRSHAVFQVYVRMTALADGQVKISKLSMIDLAGSERGMATGFKGMRFKEGSNINKSLLALGNCISGLADNLRHIPYRDSKLTRLLKDSLGGNCQTIMIANISPSSASYEDTYNTLKFASRAKKITTKLTKNILSSDTSVSHYMKLVDNLETENTLLKSKIRALERTVTDSARAYSQMPDMSVWCNHLNDLFDEKNKLCRRLLSVKSEQHLLEWRISYKNSIRDIMDNEDSSQVPVYGISIRKIESSVKKFEGRLTALQTCTSDLNSQLKDNNEKLTKLFCEMEEARVLQYVKKDLELKNASLRSTINEVTNKHLTRLLMLQQRRAETCERALKMKEPLLKKYHTLLSGLNMVTKSMATEYENSVNMMEGIKSVSWGDTDPEEIDAPGTNIISAVDLSFDDSLFTIDSCHTTLKLQPKVLPITDMKDDENITQNDTRTESEQKDANETVVKPNEEHDNVDNNCVNSNMNIDENDNDNDDEDEDTANSTITLDAPSIPSLFSAATGSDINDILPPATPAIPLSSTMKSTNLNETVTVDTNDKLSVPQASETGGQPLIEKKEVNTTFQTAKKKPDFSGLTFSSKKFNKGPMHRSNKENIMDLKDITKNNVNDKNKTNGFKQSAVKAPAVDRNQKHIDRLLSMKSALKSKSVNVTTSSVTGTTLSFSSQVPLIQSLKITHPKNRIKSHPYKRPETKSRVTDKKR